MAFNKLSNAEAERLALLAEELGECLQAIGKILRHGYDGFASREIHSPDNRERLEHEVADVRVAISLMFFKKDLNWDHVIQAEERKLRRLGQYLHHNDVDPMTLIKERTE